MSQKSRKEQLIEKVTSRLAELELDLLIPVENMSDEEFEELLEEAIRLREVLRALGNLD